MQAARSTIDKPRDDGIDSRMSQSYEKSCKNISRTLEEDMTMTTSTTAGIAAIFTAMLKEGRHEEAAARFNSPDIVSIEAMEGPMARIQGTAAVKAKSDWWYGAHEIHSATAEGPYVNGDQFSVIFAMDITQRDNGQRMQMQEVGLYTVKDGQIIEERFFY
jgi:ketosteroid isomerase-like protein